MTTSNIVIFTQYDQDYQPLADMVLPNWTEYAQKQGYDLRVFCGTYHDPSWWRGFQKTKHLYDILFGVPNDIDFVLCLDLDILFMNMGTRIESFIDDQHDFFIHRFWGEINAGSYIIRKTPWSEQWLRFIIESEPRYRHDQWYEQRAMINHEGEPQFAPHIKTLPFPGINALMYQFYPNNKWPESTPGQFRKGDFILHLAGFKLHERLAQIKSAAVQDLIIR